MYIKATFGFALKAEYATRQLKGLLDIYIPKTRKKHVVETLEGYPCP